MTTDEIQSTIDAFDAAWPGHAPVEQAEEYRYHTADSVRGCFLIQALTDDQLVALVAETRQDAAPVPWPHASLPLTETVRMAVGSDTNPRWAQGSIVSEAQRRDIIDDDDACDLQRKIG